jgi:hypothetical protein
VDAPLLLEHHRPVAERVERQAGVVAGHSVLLR